MLENTNRLCAIVAIAFYVSAILIFVFRFLDMPPFGNWIGYFEFPLAIPLIYLLLKAPQLTTNSVLCPDWLYASMVSRGGNSGLHSKS
jgi:hypothetical protein